MKNGNRSYLCNNLCNNISSRSSFDATTISRRSSNGNESRSPAVVSGETVYIAWWTNKTANNNEEVMFRASMDGGATFGPITNLSNSDNADSINTEISAEGGNVIVSWWERNQTAMVPVARVSTDSGQTFGDRLNITANPFGTIGRAEEGE
ncbi:MAG TPA: hypothetical protein VGW09_06555 [Nitrososphaeraceae archaeon]|nr:hypothetical protein [Nitrososphaeraceae archaeon]